MSADMRILIVGPLPPPYGGMAHQTRQLLERLGREGLEAKLVQTNASPRPLFIAGVPVVRAVVRLVPYVIQLWRSAKRADVVHVMANSGLSWHLLAAPAIRIARIRGRPVVVNYRGGLAKAFLARSAGSVRRTLGASRVVVPSAYLQSVFKDYGVSAAIIPNAVDAELFKPRAGEAGASRVGYPHVVIARNLEKIYGVDLALRAIPAVRLEFPACRISVAGEGPERARLEELATSLGLGDSVRFTGRLDHREMATLYQDADLMLNPVRADNMPNSVLEALACAVPVVSTSVGGIPYLVRHAESAWLVEPESPQALADGVLRVLRDDALRSALVAAGLSLVQSFSWPAICRSWMELYRELTD